MPVAVDALMLSETKRPKSGLERRGFLKLAGAGGLVLAFDLNSGSVFAAAKSDAAKVNAYVAVAPDNSITIYAINPELGQGIKTSFGMIIAEELDADWSKVKVLQAPTSPTLYGQQSSGGSMSTPRCWDPMRQAGATARAMLIAAAAEQWNVSGFGMHHSQEHGYRMAPAGARRAMARWRRRPPSRPYRMPRRLTLKTRQEYKLLGTRVSQVDSGPLVTGKGLFGIDVRLPKMVYANYTKCPAVGGKPTAANLDRSRHYPASRTPSSWKATAMSPR